MVLVASLIATAALAAPESPPEAASIFLSAVASGDLRAARAALSEDVVIMDERRGDPVASTLEAFAGHVRGCERTGLTWDVDQEDRTRAAVTVTWACPSRPDAQAFIWTVRTRVVHIQFGASQAH
jgi:hypothetical protein